MPSRVPSPEESEVAWSRAWEVRSFISLAPPKARDVPADDLAACPQRQPNHEGAAAAFLGPHLDRAAVLLDDVPSAGQSQAGPRDLTAHVTGSTEALEDVREVGRG